MLATSRSRRLPTGRTGRRRIGRIVRRKRTPRRRRHSPAHHAPVPGPEHPEQAGVGPLARRRGRSGATGNAGRAHRLQPVRRGLVKTVGQSTVDDILTNGLRHYRWRNQPFIPVEFSVAAYRFGHSQVRPSYRANFATNATEPTQQFFALIFDPRLPDSDGPPDLRGGKRAPRPFIDWQTFFDFGDGAGGSEQADRHQAVHRPVRPARSAPGRGTSLASRNLLRNWP